jgi:hypothetical protein
MNIGFARKDYLNVTSSVSAWVVAGYERVWNCTFRESAYVQREISGLAVDRFIEARRTFK